MQIRTSLAHIGLHGSICGDVAAYAYASAAVMHVHRRPGLSKVCRAAVLSRAVSTTGMDHCVGNLCRSPDAKVACGCTAQRRARILASGARRASPRWPLSGTSDFITLDWDMISKVRARPPVCLDELYTAMAGCTHASPSRDHEVFPTKAGYHINSYRSTL